MHRIEGVVQHYAWGDREFIPRLLGVEPDGEPWAELWLGTHPNGPSRLPDGRPLSAVTGELPYLLKVLAAGQPLSLQTHPNADQAVDGHRRGVYPDANAKPELLLALTPFVALCGIRPVERTMLLLDELGAYELAKLLVGHGPGAAIEALYRGRIDAGPIIDACADSTRASAVWAHELGQRYPGEPSVAATLLLNLVELAPGEAIRLDAGNLHAYLEGAGIELMGASDNVVRGGLTVKEVDVDELLRVVDPTPLEHPVLLGDDRFELPAAGVALAWLRRGTTHTATAHELAIGLDGAAWHLEPGDTVDVGTPMFAVVAL